VAEWILFQNQVNSDRMGAAIFTSGPYIEMVIFARDAHDDTYRRGRCRNLARSAW